MWVPPPSWSRRRAAASRGLELDELVHQAQPLPVLSRSQHSTRGAPLTHTQPRLIQAEPFLLPILVAKLGWKNEEDLPWHWQHNLSAEHPGMHPAGVDLRARSLLASAMWQLDIKLQEVSSSRKACARALQVAQCSGQGPGCGSAAGGDGREDG